MGRRLLHAWSRHAARNSILAHLHSLARKRRLRALRTAAFAALGERVGRARVARRWHAEVNRCAFLICAYTHVCKRTCGHADERVCWFGMYDARRYALCMRAVCVLRMCMHTCRFHEVVEAHLRSE